MKTRYRYKIFGNLKPDITFPIKVAELSIEFLIQDGNITAIDILENADLETLPKFTKEPKGIHTLNIGNVSVEKFKKPLKLAEGLLAPFGLHEIITDTVEIEWIPENDEEKNLLQIQNFTFREEPQEINHVISYDLIARPFIAAFLNTQYEVALSFFRQGKNDMRNGKYIEAYYDFYFVLEATYGFGKTKNEAIEQEFMKNDSLMQFVEKVKNNEDIVTGMKADHKNEFVENYKNKDISSIVKNIVRKRGFLHHQNPKHPLAWSPDKQEQVHVDSIFMMYLTYEVAFNIVESYIYNDSVLSSYSDQYDKSGFSHSRE